MGIKCRYLDYHKDAQGNIYGYTLVDENGKQVNLYTEALINYIKDGTLEVENLELNHRGSLVYRNTQNKQVVQVEQKVKHGLEINGKVTNIDTSNGRSNVFNLLHIINIF